MTYLELVEKRTLLVTALEAAINTGKAEDRKLSTIEDNEVARLTKELELLDTEIESKRNINNKDNKNNKKNMEKFSLRSFLNNLAEGRNFNETELEIIEEGKRGFLGAGLSYRGTTLPFEVRAIAATGNAVAAVEEDKFNILMPLRDSLVFTKAGANMLTGLVGDISIPVMTGSTAAWKGENVTASDGGNGFTEITLAPKRLTTYLAVSKQLLIQNSEAVDAKLMEDLVFAIKGKLEATVLGTAQGTTTQPAGLFYGASYGSVTGATSFAKAVALETAVNVGNADVDKMFYLVNPSTLGVMKTTAKAANTAAFIADNGTINGYPYIKSNALPTVSTGKGILFGDFSKLYVAQWGNLDITVDNVTGAKDGVINFIINSYWDVKPVYAASIAKGWLQ